VFVFASRARSKSREIDSISPAGSIDSTHIAIPGPLRGSAGAAAFHGRSLFPEICDFHHLLPVFALVGASIDGETPVAACPRMR
jgi:hypothetical protein